MVALLGVGDRIDLVATDPQGGGVARRGRRRAGARLPPPDARAVDGQPGALVVVGVAPAEVTALADARRAACSSPMRFSR